MSKSSKSTKADTSSASLKDQMARLNEIVGWFGNEDIDLEQATAKYDEGMALVEQIKERLAQTESRINQIMLQYDSKISIER